METINVTREDIKKIIYFVTNMTQKLNSPMIGALSSKRDFMGGILDRWINLIPESVIFNKLILPKINSDKKIEVITDFYDYDPKANKAGIAPDVIGIKIDDLAIPFVEFNDKWEAIISAPQIEVKSFKKNQKMITLRNQGYENKYLVLAETNFRIDYLVPLFAEDLFSSEIYDSIHMDDSIFIKSDVNNYIAQSNYVDVSNNNIGEIKLLKITKFENFMNTWNLCGPGVSVEYFNGIREVGNINLIRDRFREPKLISEFLDCKNDTLNTYSFNSQWYDAFDDNQVSIRNNKKTITLDLLIKNFEQIKVIKKLKNSIYIFVEGNCSIENISLYRNKYYKVDFSLLDRGSSNNPEFFLNKALIDILTDYETNLIDDIESMIEEL